MHIHVITTVHVCLMPTDDMVTIIFIKVISISGIIIACSDRLVLVAMIIKNYIPWTDYGSILIQIVELDA